MTTNHVYILGQFIVPTDNTHNQFTFKGIPTNYDVIEIHVAGSVTRDQDSGATGQNQHISCEMQDTWDTSSTGNTVDVRRMYMSYYKAWYAQNNSSWAWRGSSGYPINSGYIPVNFQNNGSDGFSKAFHTTMLLMGPNSNVPKQVFFNGSASDENAASLQRKVQGAFGLDCQRNATVNAWSKGPWRSMKMRLTNYGTYSPTTSPTFKAGTQFTMLGYTGSGEGW